MNLKQIWIAFALGFALSVAVNAQTCDPTGMNAIPMTSAWQALAGQWRLPDASGAMQGTGVGAYVAVGLTGPISKLCFQMSGVFTFTVTDAFGNSYKSDAGTANNSRVTIDIPLVTPKGIALTGNLLLRLTPGPYYWAQADSIFWQ